MNELSQEQQTLEALGNIAQAEIDTEQGNTELEQRSEVEGEEAQETETEAEEEKEPEDKPDQEPEGDEDEDLLEFENDAGEIERLPLSKVYSEYQRVGELQKQIDEFKHQQSKELPVDYQKGLEGLIEQRSKFITYMEQQLTPDIPQPNRELSNPNSEHYDPDTYWEQKNAYEYQMQERAKQTEALEQAQKEQAEQQKAWTESIRAREYAALIKLRPEMASPETQAKVSNELMKHYGFDQATLNSALDHRMWDMAADALAYKEAQSAKEKTLKVVRAKPKLLKGQARSGNSKDAARSAAMDKLSETGSEDAARAALKTFL